MGRFPMPEYTIASIRQWEIVHRAIHHEILSHQVVPVAHLPLVVLLVMVVLLAMVVQDQQAHRIDRLLHRFLKSFVLMTVLQMIAVRIQGQEIVEANE